MGYVFGFSLHFDWLIPCGKLYGESLNNLGYLFLQQVSFSTVNVECYICFVSRLIQKF